MNERIKQLAKQAGDYVNEVYTPPVRSKTPGKIWEDGHIDWHTQFNEKFAELIVRECIEKSLEEQIDPDLIDQEQDIEDRCYLRGSNSGIITAVCAIEQHFGVE